MSETLTTSAELDALPAASVIAWTYSYVVMFPTREMRQSTIYLMHNGRGLYVGGAPNGLVEAHSRGIADRSSTVRIVVVYRHTEDQ